MARVYVVTEEEMLSLLDQLELVNLRKRAAHAPTSTIHKTEIDDVHRTFHYVVVGWAQSVGFDGYRKR